ncbi:PspA/IM30 family protein [Aquibacillus koreensis]|uniref:PspA/IM30 family protein n=1 Tax=Aquibacillus koreensis TaxID=279446 RepID=A0A9X3WJD3_9BACI|nr:PspA/IM30 family protein [Aquibacillus koreensis]MCT2538214.1 PspA/IM30 family protein [Aquibacillus koreensis]MDC3420842.1 PspA/IM30 family protein [Aquibacillus koreensis]
MANLFTRIKDTVVADFHGVLDQKEQKNPITHLNQYVRECENEVKKMKFLVEKQYTMKQEFTRELNQARVMLEKRTRQAKLALEANEQELHEQAMEEVKHYETRVEQLTDLNDKTVNDLETLESKYVQMRHKLKDLYVKRLELRSRENVARAHNGMNKVLQTDLVEKSVSKFAEMVSYIERLETQVKTDYRLHTLDARLAGLEKSVATAK